MTVTRRGFLTSIPLWPFALKEAAHTAENTLHNIMYAGPQIEPIMARGGVMGETAGLRAAPTDGGAWRNPPMIGELMRRAGVRPDGTPVVARPARLIFRRYPNDCLDMRGEE